MENIIIQQPGKIVFGAGSIDRFIRDLSLSVLKRLFELTIPSLKDQIEQLFYPLADCGITCQISAGLNTEPGFRHYLNTWKRQKLFNPME